MNLGLATEVFNPAEDHRWLGSKHGTDTAKTITLDASAFSALGFADGVVPSGVVLAKITTSGLYGPYDKAGTGGLGTAVGFLFTTQNTEDFTVDTPAALLWHGSVIVANLPTDHGLNVTAAGQLPGFNFVGDTPADPV